MDKKYDHGWSAKTKELYTWIRKHGVASKNDLLAHTDLPVSTLTRQLDDMVSQGLLEEAGLGESSGGRRPLLYRTNPRFAYVFGLDISRTKSSLILTDLHMQTIRSQSWIMTDTTTPEVLFAQVKKEMRHMLESEKIGAEQLLGMGVGAVGPVDRERGALLDPRYFPAPGWSNVKVRDEFEAEFPFPVVLDNGANTAILAEYWTDSPLDTQHMLYVRAGVGLRSSMIFGGQLAYGAYDMEGAVGQMIIRTDSVPHRDRPNVYGALESYVSIGALEQDVQNRLKLGRESVLTEWIERAEEADFAMLLGALDKQDALVVDAFSLCASYFGIGLANLLNTLHPQSVILGGPLIVTNDLFFDVCTKVAVNRCYHYPQYNVQFRKERLGENAVAIGAAVRVIDETFA